MKIVYNDKMRNFSKYLNNWMSVINKLA